MRLTILSLLALVAIVLACEDDDEDATDTADTQNPQSIGRVDSGEGTVKRTALVNGHDAYEGEEIMASWEIQTGEKGRPQGFVKFILDGGVDCETYRGSLLQVRPDEDLLIEWFKRDGVGEEGTSVCAKARGPRQEYGIGTRATLTIQDPIFGVATDGDLAIIKMVHGTGTVIVDGAREFTLTAGNQLVVPLDESSKVQSEEQPLKLSDSEWASVERLQEVSPLPDLVPQFLDYASSPTDENCEIRYRIANRGEGDARDSLTRVAIDESSVELPTPELPGNKSVELSATFDGPCPTPELSGKISVDTSDVVAEREEDNNDAEILVSLTATPLPPDLAVEFGDYVLGEETCEIEYVVTNRGKGSAGESLTGVTIGDYNMDEPTPALSPGGSTKLSTTFSVPCPFTPDLQGTLIADVGDDLRESNESNNSAEILVFGVD